MSDDLDSKKRFSSRVSDYVKYRPDYPRRILGILHETIGLSSDWRIADVGCGTGISCRMFLENGNEVFGVEPNDDMRLAAEREFESQPRFHPVSGSAEATGLPDGSVDLVVAAQAFHWFDRHAIAREWRRILRAAPGGFVLVMWNTRLTNGDFAREYDRLLLQHGTDYQQVAHRTPISAAELGQLFGAPFERVVVPNQQTFGWDDLCGRVRSSSYTPLPGQSGHDELFAGLKELFDRCNTSGLVRFEYETELFLSRVKG
jgi:SAM-dependent methyltransferase